MILNTISILFPSVLSLFLFRYSLYICIDGYNLIGLHNLSRLLLRTYTPTVHTLMQIFSLIASPPQETEENVAPRLGTVGQAQPSTWQQ